MLLNIEQVVHDYLNEFGYLHENDTLILNEEIKIKEAIKDIRRKYKKKRQNLEKYKDEALEKLKDSAQDIGKEVGEELLVQIEKQKAKIRTVYLLKKSSLNSQEAIELAKIKNIAKHGAMTLSGIGLASLLIYVSFKFYKENKKLINQECGDKKGKLRERCIRQFRIKVLTKRLSFLDKSLIKCNYSKDPVKCRDKIDEELLKVREKIKSEMDKLGKQILGTD
jgi:hypothetical protein